MTRGARDGPVPTHTAAGDGPAETANSESPEPDLGGDLTGGRQEGQS